MKSRKEIDTEIAKLWPNVRSDKVDKEKLKEVFRFVRNEYFDGVELKVAIKKAVKKFRKN